MRVMPLYAVLRGRPTAPAGVPASPVQVIQVGRRGELLGLPAFGRLWRALSLANRSPPPGIPTLRLIMSEGGGEGILFCGVRGPGVGSPLAFHGMSLRGSTRTHDLAADVATDSIRTIQASTSAGCSSTTSCPRPQLRPRSPGARSANVVLRWRF